VTKTKTSKDKKKTMGVVVREQPIRPYIPILIMI